MKLVRRRSFWTAVCFVGAIILGTSHCRGASGQANRLKGATTEQEDALASAPFWANNGRWTFGFQIGYGLENAIPRNVSHINMIVAQPQLGFIAWDSPHSCLPVNRFELIGEGILGSAYHPGGSLFGGTMLLRFGFKPIGHVVPFFDAGSGPLHTTLDENAIEVTGHTQFLSEGGAGLQFFVRPQRAIVLEYRYFHMSNAGLQEPNHGFNGSMLTVGFRWLRRPRLLNAASSQHPRHFLHIR